MTGRFDQSVAPPESKFGLVALKSSIVAPCLRIRAEFLGSSHEHLNSARRLAGYLC